MYCNTRCCHRFTKCTHAVMCTLVLSHFGMQLVTTAASSIWAAQSCCLASVHTYRFGVAPSASNNALVPEAFQRQLNEIKSLLTSMNAQRGALPADEHRDSPNGMPIEYLTLA